MAQQLRCTQYVSESQQWYLEPWDSSNWKELLNFGTSGTASVARLSRHRVKKLYQLLQIVAIYGNVAM